MNQEPVLCSGIILCERIIREERTGKNSLIGCFNNFNVVAFPVATLPFFAMAMLTNFKGDFESLETVLRVEDSKLGHVLFSTAGSVKLTRPVKLEGSEIIEVPFPISPFMIHAPGVYYVIVLVNNEIIGKRPFHVTAITTGMPPIG